MFPFRHTNEAAPFDLTSAVIDPPLSGPFVLTQVTFWLYWGLTKATGPLPYEATNQRKLGAQLGRRPPCYTPESLRHLAPLFRIDFHNYRPRSALDNVQFVRLSSRRGNETRTECGQTTARSANDKFEAVVRST